MAIAGLVCGALGLIIGIAIQVLVVSAFTDYMKKSKKIEASLQLNYHMETSSLPPSTEAVMPGPDGAACSSPSNKLPRRAQSEWEVDPGWKAMGFHIDEDTLFSYHWTRVSPTEGYALAVGDLDCDTTLSTYRLDIRVVEGNVQDQLGDPSPD